ncbi:MAG: RidA family protein [Pseudomonadales bacterium]
MPLRQAIQTNQAPAAIGPYSQAIRAGKTVYLSGQIPLVPDTMELIEGDIKAQTHRVFQNLKAVAEASGGSLAEIVKLNISLTDLSHFTEVNAVMTEYFTQPYPARACVGVASLPKDSAIEVEAILVLAD